jgi:hypothetical protein
MPQIQPSSEDTNDALAMLLVEAEGGGGYP